MPQHPDPESQHSTPPRLHSDNRSHLPSLRPQLSLTHHEDPASRSFCLQDVSYLTPTPSPSTVTGICHSFFYQSIKVQMRDRNIGHLTEMTKRQSPGQREGAKCNMIIGVANRSPCTGLIAVKGHALLLLQLYPTPGSKESTRPTRCSHQEAATLDTNLFVQYNQVLRIPFPNCPKFTGVHSPKS